jgi:hypothetical protein
MLEVSLAEYSVFKDSGSKPEVVYRCTILYKIRVFLIVSDSPRQAQCDYIEKLAER